MRSITPLRPLLPGEADIDFFWAREKMVSLPSVSVARTFAIPSRPLLGFGVEEVKVDPFERLVPILGPERVAQLRTMPAFRDPIAGVDRLYEFYAVWRHLLSREEKEGKEEKTLFTSLLSSWGESSSPIFDERIWSKEKQQHQADLERAQKAVTVQQGVVQCPKCKSWSTTSVESQNRSGDEAMSYTSVCFACNNRWSS